jgi:hypothetical protein
MTIFVDPPKRYETKLRHKVWSHMVSDTSADELHEFAQRLGLKRAWSQGGAGKGPHHYDVTPAYRAKALVLGAVEVSSRELVRKNYDGHFARQALRAIP